eukprot:2061213-Pyramimonas_sp.AAC.1
MVTAPPPPAPTPRAKKDKTPKKGGKNAAAKPAPDLDQFMVRVPKSGPSLVVCTKAVLNARCF